MRITQNQYTPWCQGLVFVTGELGQDIEISSDNYDLAVCSKALILIVLTDSEFITAHFNHKLVGYQRELVVIAICDFDLFKEKLAHIKLYQYSKFIY